MQTRLMSLIEARANVVVGYALAVLTQMLVVPLFGFHPGLTANLKIGLGFTVLSLARVYLIRRFFDRLRTTR